MDADDILSIATEIKQSRGSVTKKTETYKTKYPEFADKYPSLFAMCCDDKSDINHLHFMIDMLRKIQENAMTEHVASANVGQVLYDDYVKQHVDQVKEDK